MKKVFSEKILALGLVLVAFIAAYYFYQQGEIGFLPQKEKEQEIKLTIAELPISDSQYRLSYKDKFNATFDIANFENNENWFGDGDFDFATYFEGEASLFLSSFNHQKATVSLKKNFDIKDVLDFKFLVYLATDPAYIEEFNLIFVGTKGEYKFPIREISKGWNFLVLPEEKFSEEEREGKEGEEGKKGIEEVVVELVSRPKTRSTVNLDALWAEKEDKYQKDWNADGEKLLSLKKNGEAVSLLAVGMGGSRATLERGSAKDYTFQAKFTPLKSGEFGLFLRGDYKSGYGYYLTMNGVETNTWRIYKNGLFEEKIQVEDLAKGEISNFKMDKNKPYWLKVEMKGPKVSFYFSPDGKNFTKLGEASDISFVSGGLGISVSAGNMVFIDDLHFFQ